MTSVMSAHDARIAAEAYLDRAHAAIRSDIAVVSVTEYPTCWVVAYNSRAWIETRALSDLLIGGGPIIVNKKTGQVREGTTALAVADQLDPV